VTGTARRWPAYDSLPTPNGDHLRVAWETFGRGDQLGTINFLTPDRIAEAARLVRRGRVFNLDHPINAFEPYPAATRTAASHHIFSTHPYHRDDFLDSFYLQGTSQVDSLRHIGHPRLGFYGGRRQEDIREGTSELGIHNWAQTGIVGRGVLLDVAGYLAAEGRPLDAFASHPISGAELEATATHQRVGLQGGDLLLVRTGWAARYLALDAEAREQWNRSPDRRSPGLAQTVEVVRWLWDHEVALVAADNLGVEAASPDVPSEFMGPPETGRNHNGMLHRPLIALLGMALGELWALEELAEDCRADGVYEFFLVSKPLNLVGGVGSPANAVAIK
jgi:kynurenine formamidase